MPPKHSPARPRLTFFGHFGQGNFGNDCTLEAVLYNTRRKVPAAEINCICTNPEAVEAEFHLSAIGINVSRPHSSGNLYDRWKHNPLIRIATEPYRWLKIFHVLRCTDMFVVPGTGLLNDAYSLLGWGPYNLFKWSLIARLCGCKVVFLSVGAGPLYTRLGRYFVKTALSLAQFRSYRETSTAEYLQKIGVNTDRDFLFPDLAFSLPEGLLPAEGNRQRGRRVVGIGLMPYAGKYSSETPSSTTYTDYLNVLAHFVEWLFAHEYDVRLILGEAGDEFVITEFTAILKQRVPYDEARVTHEPAVTVAQIFSQIASTDFVVATRFHNILFSVLLNKPVIAISFHHKCASLMNNLELIGFTEDIHDLKTEALIEKFSKLEADAPVVKARLRHKVEQHRRSLEQQYNLIFPNHNSATIDAA